jgi:hypothetical protein
LARCEGSRRHYKNGRARGEIAHPGAFSRNYLQCIDSAAVGRGSINTKVEPV